MTKLYGAPARASEITAFLTHVLAQNATKRRVPVCIWGNHGIGKTELVIDFAKANGYELVYIAPAQFEEMGDLIGMPKIEDGRTVFAPPAWVPTSPEKGILLLDDVNRADDRILRGIMQLLQNYALASWKLPENWHIILTANPDNGDYSVTPLDDAMLTRMLHITMIFEVRDWAKWATARGINPHAINFVLSHRGELLSSRSTPRTLVQFFEQIDGIEDWKANLGLIQLLGEATLDAATVASFVAFVQQDMQRLLTPDEILNATDFEKTVATPLREMVTGEILRIDVLATVCTQLLATVTQPNFELNETRLTNLKNFIRLDFMPNDLGLTFAQDLVSAENPALRQILADPVIGRLVLRRLAR